MTSEQGPEQEDQGPRRAALIDELRALIRDERVLAAIATVPRERFVPARERRRAWANAALRIGWGQTISQPLIVARMCELLELRPSDRVLDVGTGSGYHAAVLAQLCAHVWSIEHHQQLSEQARHNLRAAGVENVTLIVGDGTLGHPPAAPYDAINVAASATEVPRALLEQLAPAGRMVLPLTSEVERLVLVRRTSGGFTRRDLEPVRFVPLIGGGNTNGHPPRRY